MMRAAIVALLGAGLILGCSAEPTPFNDGGRRGDGGAGDGAVSDAPFSRDVQAIAVDAQDPHLNPDAACATVTSATQRAPMNLLVVLDRSGSMQDNGKWTAAVRGLQSLLAMLDDDTRVGLTFFPAASNPDVETTYNTPAVPIAPLSANRATLMSRLSSTSPSGGTPMACAMPGSITHYESMFTMDGSRNIILITDGQPTDECSGSMCSLFDINCLMNASNMAKIRIMASVARAGRDSPPIRSYIVGTDDADTAFLTNLAINGGTQRTPDCAASNTCHYSLGSTTFETDLNRALDDIRGRAATCEFRVMIDPSMVDTGLVNVNYTPSGGTAQIIPRNTTHSDGWDWSTDMHSIILNGPTCDRVRADTGGTIQILFGCPTVEPG